MGTRRDNKLYCDCGEPARWYTSKQYASKGSLFVRCAKTGNDACKFFQWMRHETETGPSATSYIQQPPLLQTLPKNQSPIMIPTPKTEDDGTHRGSQIDLFRSPNNTSPTPQSSHNNPITSGDSDENLSTEVVALLRSENVVLNSSTEVQLRHIINTAVDAYEAEVLMYIKMIDELIDKLAEAKRK